MRHSNAGVSDPRGISMSDGRSQGALYQDALRTMMDCAERLRKVAKKVTEVAEKLQNDHWQCIYVCNGSQSQNSPDGTTPIELADWPSKEELQKAINEWNTSLQKVDDAWDCLGRDA
jgi:hypothetical protein